MIFFTQGPCVAAGSLFAMAQSAGAAGLAATTKLGLASGVGGATTIVASLLGEDCEPE